jgi:hypothetical protein
MVLFGTGVEFSVHLVKRFQAELVDHDPEAAMAATLDSTGRSILNSGLATTLGMAILFFSRFRGFNEFGIISGVGSASIVLAMFTVLPPLLVLGARWGWVRPRHLPTGGRAAVPGAVLTIVLGVAALGAGVVALRFLGFDYDFQRFQADTQEADAVKQKNREVYPGFKVPSAIYVCRDLAALDAMVALLEDRRDRAGVSIFGNVSSIRDFVPTGEELAKRRGLVAEIQERLGAGWTKRITDARVRRWADDLRAFAIPDEPPTLDDVPADILRRMRARDGSGEWILYLDMEGPARDGLLAMAFTEQVYGLTLPEGVRGPTGDKPVLAEILWLVTSEGPWLVGLTLLGVFVLVLIDRRSLSDSLWVLLPLGAGLTLTVGGMVALGWKLNFFNIVVLPNLIGNAVDNGVHYFRRWRETGGDARAAQQELAGPLTTSVSTTLMGYGGLLVAHHAGLRSIGGVAVLGLTCCWLTGVALMPGVLALLSRRARGR